MLEHAGSSLVPEPAAFRPGSRRLPEFDSGTGTGICEKLERRILRIGRSRLFMRALMPTPGDDGEGMAQEADAALSPRTVRLRERLIDFLEDVL